MGQFEIAGHEVMDREVKATGNGAHVYVTKRWLGEDVKVVRVSDRGSDE
jgi:putative transposon-encoded protein